MENNGGPAFPVYPGVFGDDASEYKGLSLRDYFAAKALNGFCSNIVNWPTDNFKQMVVCSYVCADAMLRQRGE